jgi:cupin 2 domain-containing protein
VLEFPDGSTRTLRAGDYLTIPRHLRHRVAATAADRPTVWLAVFLR